MTERGGQKWTLADFRRHVPRIIAERDRAESALAERDATIKRVRELCAMVGGTAVFVRDVLTALDAAGGSDDGDSP